MAKQACAACKLQRKKCEESCSLAPYFPRSCFAEFRDAHKLFGVSNILKMINSVEAERRKDAADSILFEAKAWRIYPVHGCLGAINELKAQIEAHRKDLEEANLLMANREKQRELFNAQMLSPPDQVSNIPLGMGASERFDYGLEPLSDIHFYDNVDLIEKMARGFTSCGGQE